MARFDRTKDRTRRPTHLDDDENVKALRDTAKAIGLTQTLLTTKRSLGRALRLLGVKDEGGRS